MTRIPRRVALLTMLVLAVAPAGGLAGGTKFSGKTEQSRPVSFTLSSGKVKNFVAGVNVYCTNGGVEFNAAIPPGSMKVKSGKFSYKGRDKKDSANIEITGKVSGAKASGTVSMNYSKYNGSTGYFDPCGGSAKWSAKRK
jgi:hypothetical protein